MYEPNTIQCLHCGKQLPFLNRVKGLNFCDLKHREAYLTALDTAILARLGNKRAIVSTESKRPLVGRRRPNMELVPVR